MLGAQAQRLAGRCAGIAVAGIDQCVCTDVRIDRAVHLLQHERALERDVLAACAARAEQIDRVFRSCVDQDAVARQRAAGIGDGTAAAAGVDERVAAYVGPNVARNVAVADRSADAR